jgi:acyl carrier protein
MSIQEKITRILVERFAIDAGLIYPHAKLKEDLQLDSIDAVDLFLAINEAFLMRVPEKAFEKVHTVADLVMMVESHRIISKTER